MANLVEMRRALLAWSVFALSLLAPRGLRAQEELTGRDLVIAYNVGLRVSIAPGLVVPTSGGRLGFSIAGDVRYGFLTGPVVLAPGVRLAGYFPDEGRALAGLATFRATFPVGPVGPFVVGGVGPGHVRPPSHTGLAWIAGGGFMAHVGTHFGFGAEASYQAITGSDFAVISVGPTVLIAF